MTEVAFVGMAVVDFLFEVEQIPMTAEKHRAEDISIVGGGCAATAAVAAARLGASARMIGRLGDDAVGDQIVEGLRAEGVDCAGLHRAIGAKSSCSSVLVDGAGERLIVNFRGEGLIETAEWIDIGAATAVLADPRWVPGALVALEAARRSGVPGVLDGEAPTDPALVKAASHVAFSRQGLCDFSGLEDREAGLRAVEADWVCVTDGAAGCFIREKGEITHIASYEVQPVDTLGAGDVWHGAFTLHLAEGSHEHDAVRFANAAAALKCTRRGGREGAPTRAELTDFMKGQAA